MKALYVFAITVLLVVSCGKPENKKITPDHFSDQVEQLKAKLTDSTDIHLLEYIEQQPDAKRNELIQQMKVKKLRYIELFQHLDSANSIADSYNPKFEKILSAIDGFCMDHQNEMEQFLALKKQMNQMCNIRVLALRETKWDRYEDVIELKVRASNRSGREILKTNFNIKLYKNQNSIIIPGFIGYPISPSYNESLIFDEKAHARQHGILNELIKTGYQYSFQITRIVFNDEVIDLSKYEIGQFFTENNFMGNDPQLGQSSEFCPYLEDNDPMILEINTLIEERDTKIKTKYPFVYDFWKSSQNHL